MSAPRFLLLEDNPLDANVVQVTLTDGGIECELQIVDTRAKFEAALAANSFDLILADYILPGFDGLTALEIAQAQCPEVPFIFVSGTLGEELAIDALKLGATDYVMKQRLTRLVFCVKRALREAQERRDRKQAELALQQSEVQNQAILAALPDLLLRFTADGVYRNVFASGCNFNVISVDATGKSMFEVLPSKMAEQAYFHLQKALQTGELQVYEQEVKVGERYQYEEVRVIKSGEDEVLFVIRDISDRKQLELALRNSEAQLSQIFNNAGAAIGQLSVYPDGTFVHGLMSVGCETVYGYSQAEMIGDTELWQSRVLPEDWESIIMPSYEQIFGGHSFSVEYRFRDKTDTIRWIAENLATHWDEAAGCWRVTTVATNISDRKQAELALKQQIRQEYLLADIAQEIRQSLELEQVLHSTVDRVREWLECDRVVIFRFRPDWHGDIIMESVADNWLAIQSTSIVDPCFEDRFIEPYRQGHVSVLPDIHQSGLDPCYVKLLQQFQVQASLAVPIFQGHDLWGLLITHQCSAPRQWQPAEVAILRRLSTQVGIAIQQAELYDQICSELAARQQMQAVLEESEARFRSLSAAAPIGICQFNAAGACLYVNPRWCKISGLDVEDNLGDGWLQAVHPDDRDRLASSWASYLQGGSDRLPEFRLLTPQGETRWISARIAAIQSATGETIGYVSTDEDITERKQAEEALRESEQRLQAILDHSPASIYLLDADNRHLLVNHSYAEQLATSPAQLIGKSLHEVWPEAIADTYAAQNCTILETGQLIQIEDTAPLADGVHRYLTIKFPLYDATSTPYALCGISTDITEKKKLEAQFYQSQRLESLGTLAGGIAHDLNNALTPILAIAQLLRMQPSGLDQQTQEMLQVLESSAKRGAKMVQQILTFTTGTGDERTSVNVALLVQEVVNVAQQTLPKVITVHAIVPAERVRQVFANATQLHQVLMNLCVNARDAMPQGGTLTLSVENFDANEIFAQMNLDAHVGEYVLMTVTDTGTGIAPEVRDRIFDPFFTTKAHGQGTGLGLSTVLGIVKSYGGFVQVVSEVGQGSQFKVYLPAIETTVASKPQKAPLPLGQGELILVVDDEEHILRATRAILETHHYQVLTAKNGAEAIATYAQRQQEIVVVLVDMMMPDIDGTTVIRALQEIQPQVRAIAISGLLPQYQNSLATLNITTHLNKPYTTEDLLNRISSLLSKE